MATAWPQGAQPPTQNHGMQYSSNAPPLQRKSTNPPPVCYVCEGPHFVKDCPQTPRPVASSFPQPPPQTFQQYPRPAPPVQAYPPQAGPPQPSYAPYPQNQHYGNPAPQPAYNQPPQQPYTAQPVPQYGRSGYQPPHYNQFPQQIGPLQYGGPGYQAPPQPYGPPATAPYQPPGPYTQPSAAYGGPHQGPPVSYQAPAPQWNPPHVARPPVQQLRRSASFQQREFSAPSTQQSQSQQPLDYGPEAPKQEPQTPVSSHGGLQPGIRQGSQSSPATAVAESKVASAASTPHNQQLPNMGLVRKESTHSLVSEGQASEKASDGKDGDDAVRAASETPTPEDEDAQFDWDFKYIFKPPERKETVALAQPLSANFKSTPVPLVQAWSILVPSISRYARKDNEKEFIRSIRHAPQWSFLQEDPGFSDEPLEGPLIPFSEVQAWAAARHKAATPEPHLEQEFENRDGPDSRKRPRSEEQEEGQIDEQDDMDYQDELDTFDSEANGPRIKRQKNEEDEGQLDELMGTPTTRTPVLTNARAGTPCLETDDDAWAPEVGERAASPMDPTEALLASLGVSGSPKPVKQESLPPYASTNEESQSSQAQTPLANQHPRTDSIVPAPSIEPTHGLPKDNAYGNASHNQQWDSPAKTPQVKPQWNPPLGISQGASTAQPQPQWDPQPKPSYAPPTNTQYGNGAPAGSPGPPGPPTNQPYVNSQYGSHTNPPYANGPAPYAAPMNQHYGQPANAPYGPPNGYQQGAPQPYGPAQTPSYGTAPPYNAPQPYPQQYGPPVAFQQGPLQYVQPNAPYGPPSNFPQGAPQYVPQRTPSYGNGPPAPSHYGAPPQSSPVQYGPPQNLPYNAYPNPLQQYGTSGPQGPYPNTPQPNAPYQNGPPVQPPYGNAPPRQDSGYVSARGSYSNGSGPPDNFQQNSAQNPAQSIPQNDLNHQPGPSQPLQGFGQTQNQDQKDNPQEQSDRRNGDEEGGADTTNSHGTNSTEDEGTPLSPTSAEILGKLVRKNSSGDGSRQKSDRKIKRPQPVVADAYSRRW